MAFHKHFPRNQSLLSIVHHKHLFPQTSASSFALSPAISCDFVIPCAKGVPCILRRLQRCRDSLVFATVFVLQTANPSTDIFAHFRHVLSYRVQSGNVFVAFSHIIFTATTATLQRHCCQEETNQRGDQLVKFHHLRHRACEWSGCVNLPVS